MNILLTGGAGYVGSACLRWLLKQDHNAIAYDNLSTGNAWSVPEHRLITADLHDGESLRSALREHEIEAVIHLGALAVVPDSVRDPESYWRENVVATKSLLDAMRDCDVNKLVLSSTCAVYGDDPPIPITEDAPMEPSHPYGATKAAAERMISDYSQAYGLGYTHLRYFNVAGADSDGKYGESRAKETHLIPLVFYAATGKIPRLKIYGDDWPTRDGSCVRDYVHTEDLARAHQLALETLEPGMGRAYNVGTGEGVTVKEVFAACRDVVGAEIPFEIAGRRPGDPAVLYACSDKIQSELGWSPRYKHIRDTVETAWRWHVHHAKD